MPIVGCRYQTNNCGISTKATKTILGGEQLIASVLMKESLCIYQTGEGR